MNALEIKNLTKHYKSFTLNNLSLTLPGGCIMGLVGENGAGKSTTLKLILDIIKRDSGTITVLGCSDQADMTLVKQDIGVVFDEPAFPLCLNARQIGAVLKHTYTNWDDEHYLHLLTRFSLPLDKEFKDFSRGMKMKLSIAAALSHKAKLLLLDEPTGGLDPVVRDEIVDILFDFARDEEHSILISSHIVSDLEKLCDYIAFLHKGELLLCDEKDKLLSQYALVRCSKEQFNQLPESAVRHKKQTPYYVDAMMLRQDIPSGFEAFPVTIEDLFLFMVKEGE
ncbi:MAG: ABC transporter ATP-binding protein [Clostridia bacterium]|nr:ABC transporter ATP-binding protein [Clostridia bacterium]